jgi:methylphosphotriester-DNA--protein-cysteine methyltransferase
MLVYPPSPVLQPYIRYFAISEMTEEHTYKVLPDDGLVMGFQYKGRLSLLQESGELRLNFSGLSGLHDTWRMFKNAAHTGTVLVYFKEGAAAFFFQQPMHELFGQSLSLDLLMRDSELQLLQERLAEAVTDVSRVQIMEQLLISRIQPKDPDPLVTGALSVINQHHGTLKIRDLLKQLHVSQSSLEKRFRQVVGTSPKKYAGIVRLKHVIEHYDPTLSLTATAYDAGFYDQAHFIKEFKAFTGEAPENFFRSL